MNRLFIDIYLDEDVNVLVADLVRGHGFAATTARDAGLLGERDAVQLEYAVSQRKAFATHNRGDFVALAREYQVTGRTHWGLILAIRRPPREITRRLLLILNQVTADEMRDQVRYI